MSNELKGITSDKVELFKQTSDDVFKTLLGVGKYEYLLLQHFGHVSLTHHLNIDNFKKQLHVYNSGIHEYLTSIIYEDGQEIFTKNGGVRANKKVKNLINKGRVEIINMFKQNLIGTEIKRGCQYDREWISAIDVKNDMSFATVTSNSGQSYDISNVRVYNTETSHISLIEWACKLKLDSLGIKTKEEN